MKIIDLACLNDS